MRLVFMGTPDFSVPTLEKLIESKHEVVAVVTGEDKVRGRGMKPSFTPVKECAVKNNIDVYTPLRIKGNEEFINTLRELNADAIIVIAYGQILPKEVIEMPKYGCINIHASILPKYRGAAPIQWAVIDGLKETGISIMQMDEGLDTGDVLSLTKIKIAANETGGSLFDKLSLLGGDALLETLDNIENGNITRTKQIDEESTYAKKLDKSIGNIDFSMKAEAIERLIRGLNPWPSAYTYMNGKILKVWEGSVYTSLDELNGFKAKEDGGAKDTGISESEKNTENEKIIEMQNSYGKIEGATKEEIIVKCKENYLGIKQLQLEGKKRMDAKTFMLGVDLSKMPTFLGK